MEDKYIIVCNGALKNFKEFIEEVNLKIRQGYVCIGGVAVVRVEFEYKEERTNIGGSETIAKDINHLYYQAMIKQ